MSSRDNGAGYGDGDWCPVPGHGRMYVMESRRQWCPVGPHWPLEGGTVDATPAGEAATNIVLPDLDIDLGGL